MRLSVSAAPDEKWLQHWKWLRFIPLNLALALPVIGFLIGRQINDPFGSGIGTIFGLLIGPPLQLLKGFANGRDQGCDLDRGKNGLQLAAGLGCALVGALTGYFMTVNRIPMPDAPLEIPSGIPTACGFILGFLVGVLFSGAGFVILGGSKNVHTWLRGRYPQE